MIDFIRDFLITVTLFCGRKQMKANWYKAIAVRPFQYKQGKFFLVFMFYMVIYPCEQFYHFTTVAFDHRIIQYQYFYPFWSGKGIEYNEMTGIVARERKYPDKSVLLGKKEKVEFEYIHYGTTSL